MFGLVTQGYGYLAQAITQFGSGLEGTEAKYWSTIETKVPQLSTSFESIKKMEAREVEVFDTGLAESLRDFLASDDAPWNTQGMDPPTKLILALDEIVMNGKEYTIANMAHQVNKSLQWKVDNARVSAEFKWALDKLITDEKVADNRVEIYQQIVSTNGDFSSLYKNELTPLAWSVLFGGDAKFYKTIGVKNTCQVTGEALKFLQDAGKQYVASFKGGQASLARLFIDLLVGVQGPLQEQSFSGIVPTERVRDTMPDNLRLGSEFKTYSSAVIVEKIVDLVALIGELVLGMKVQGDLRAGLGGIASFYNVADEPRDDMEKSVRELSIKLNPRLHRDLNQLMTPQISAGPELIWLAYNDMQGVLSMFGAMVTVAYMGYIYWTMNKEDEAKRLGRLSLRERRAEEDARKAEKKLRKTLELLRVAQARRAVTPAGPEADEAEEQVADLTQQLTQAEADQDAAYEAADRAAANLTEARESTPSVEDQEISAAEARIQAEEVISDASFWYRVGLGGMFAGLAAVAVFNGTFSPAPTVQGAATVAAAFLFQPLVVFTSSMAVAGLTFAGLAQWRALSFGAIATGSLAIPIIRRLATASLNWAMQLQTIKYGVDYVVSSSNTATNYALTNFCLAVYGNSGYVASQLLSGVGNVVESFPFGDLVTGSARGLASYFSADDGIDRSWDDVSVGLFAAMSFFLFVFAARGLAMRNLDNRPNARAANIIFYWSTGAAFLSAIVQTVRGLNGAGGSFGSDMLRFAQTGDQDGLIGRFSPAKAYPRDYFATLQNIVAGEGYRRVFGTMMNDIATPWGGAVIMGTVFVSYQIRRLVINQDEHAREVMADLEDETPGLGERLMTLLRIVKNSISFQGEVGAGPSEDEATTTVATFDPNDLIGGSLFSTFGNEGVAEAFEADEDEEASSSAPPPFRSSRAFSVAMDMGRAVSEGLQTSADVAGQALATVVTNVVEGGSVPRASPPPTEDDRDWQDDEGFEAMLGDPSMPETPTNPGPSGQFKFEFDHFVALRVHVWTTAGLVNLMGPEFSDIPPQSGSWNNLQTDSDIRRPFVPDEPLSSFDPSRRVTS